ncbi:MAG TPA: MobF family relaxase [Acidimicrobiales bacterium]|nr:MobF family relaxase [Acidimicrobiales bacterium]
MLRIHVVREGGHHYYVNDLVPGRAEGTLVAGEEPGRWWGGGSVGLGLRGTVESQAFAEVLAGRDPVSGRSLRVRRGPDSVAAYDLTFAAPKSVSILHLLAPREIATEVGAGHQEAVNDATDYLGRAAVGVRRTRGGTVSFLPSTGAVSGHFVHRTSRTLDPHLHTHVVVANVAQGVDGSWSAVDSRRVYAHAHAARGVYHARLRLELSERIGATWDLHASGLGDVIGVDGNLRRLFSQRSAAMDEYRFTRAGPSQHPSRLGAFHATRPDKDRTRTVESLLLEWKRRAADFGFDLGDLTMVVGCKRNLEAGNDIDPQRVRDRLVEFAQANRTMAPRDLVAVVAAASTLGATARVVQSVARQLEEASGPPLGTERRWPAGEVARALERDSAAILAGPALSGDGRLGIGPSPATAGPQLGQGRSRADQAARSGRREASHHLTR